MDHEILEPVESEVATHEEAPKGASWRGAIFQFVREVVEAAILAVLLFVLLQSTVQNTVVEGHSMEPNLADGQRLLVNKVAYWIGEPQRGDIVVIESPEGSGKKLIKRIIGLPGETVEIRRGQVYIDGEPLQEPYHPYLGSRSHPPTRVGPDQYFVLGDNRDSSGDSRVWGAVSRDRLIGRAWISVWPPDRWGWFSDHGLQVGIAEAAR
jgi:signal peptidase I